MCNTRIVHIVHILHKRKDMAKERFGDILAEIIKTKAYCQI